VFWTTQPEACGSYTLCDNQCAIPGLVYSDVEEPGVNPEGPERTIVNVEWLRGLILNILNTRARSDLKCPTPAAIYGHWSESYREDGVYIGARFWNAADRTYARINDNVRAIETLIESDLSKLIQMEVATNVEVDAYYMGNNKIGVNISVTSPLSGSLKINLAGTLVAGGWEWR
jgi:phage gp46-like protein